MSVCYKEGLKAQAAAVQAITRSCNQDVRQVCPVTCDTMRNDFSVRNRNLCSQYIRLGLG